MNHIKVSLLLICIATTLAQDDGSKSRFDKILQDFGFTGIGADQTKNGPTVAKGRQQPVKATPRTASALSTGSAKRNRDFEIQSNAIPDARPRSQPIKKNKDSSPALAALFSVAGKPKKPKRPAQTLDKSQSRSSPSIKSPVAKVLNERIKNPEFESVSPSRSVVNNKGLIANERNIRRKDSRRNKESPRNNNKKTNLRKDVRIPARQQLPVLNKPKQQFTSRGIPIVASVTSKDKKSNLNKLKAIAGSINVQPLSRSNGFQGVPALSNPTPANANSKSAIDPVANLAKIAKQKANTTPLKSQQLQSRGRQRTVQQRNDQENVKVSPTQTNVRGQISSQRSNPQPRRPPSRKEFHGVTATQEISNSPKQKPGKTFDFDATLKDFGFSPRLISDTTFQNTRVSEVKQPNAAQVPKKPFTVFPGNARNPANQQSNVPQFTKKGIPIISSKPIPDSKTGLNSLIAIAGDPQKNPVTKTASPFVSSNQPTSIRKPNIRQGPVQNGRKSPSSRVSPNNSALGNLESIAAGNGPTFKVKNRARGPSRNIETKKLNNNNVPTKTSSSSTTSLPQKDSQFLINPFVNINLQKQQAETPRSQNAKIQENRNNVRPSEAQVLTNTNKTEKRISRPRETSNRPKIFIDKEEFEDSFEEEAFERRAEPRRNNQKKEKEERRERPKKKRPHKEKKEQKIEQRPPVVGGCFHVCETLIFEVYKLLGGSLCDCVK